jgi:hypothetical protein
MMTMMMTTLMMERRGRSIRVKAFFRAMIFVESFGFGAGRATIPHLKETVEMAFCLVQTHGRSLHALFLTRCVLALAVLR